MSIQMNFIEKKDFKIPKLGMGTWQIEGNECTRIVSEGLKMGYRLVDTAQAYENEEYVGAGIQASGVRREDIFLVSKVWRDNLSEEKILKTTRESLEKLKTDHVDLMLIHWPNDEFALESTLTGMQELLKLGLAKNFGISNFPTHLMDKVQKMAPEFVCDQVEYHPFISQESVLGWLKKHDKFMMAYSPLARGRVFKDDTLKEVAHKHGVSEAQITLAWLLSQDSVVAIPKTKSDEHLRSNLDCLQVNLDENDFKKLKQLQKTNKRLIDPDFAPRWDGQVTA